MCVCDVWCVSVCVYGCMCMMSYIHTTYRYDTYLEENSNELHWCCVWGNLQVGHHAHHTSYTHLRHTHHTHTHITHTYTHTYTHTHTHKHTHIHKHTHTCTEQNVWRNEVYYNIIIHIIIINYDNHNNKTQKDNISTHTAVPKH